eukprot:EC785284.1.p1 GENE.EC785284.1~~EC785284.1.p1  ORF type:complete len:118 (+),score=33.78 EC785284.1:34-387(+)
MAAPPVMSAAEREVSVIVSKWEFQTYGFSVRTAKRAEDGLSVIRVLFSQPDQTCPVPKTSVSVDFFKDSSTGRLRYLLEGQQFEHDAEEACNEEWIRQLHDTKRAIREQFDSVERPR